MRNLLLSFKLSLFLMLCLLFAASTAMSTPPGQNFGPPGYYQKVNGATAGMIKYFPNGHPGDPSEWVYLGEDYEPEPGPKPGPCDGCDSSGYFSGNANQYSGANFEIGNLKFDNDNLYKKGSGAMAFGSEEASASYYGAENGFGFALALGLTGFVGDEFEYDGFSLIGPLSISDGEGVGVFGLTGNISSAGVFSDGPGCASIEGSGTLGTFAAKEVAVGVGVASSHGSFNYAGSTPQGVIVGGGITAGGSGAGGGSNHVWAASGQITVSGVGSVCNFCGDYDLP